MGNKCRDCGKEIEKWKPIPGTTFIPPPKKDKCKSCEKKIIMK